MYVEGDIALAVLGCSAHMAQLLVAQVHHYVDLAMNLRLRHRLFLSSIEKEDHRCRPTVARCNPRVGQDAFNSNC